MQTLLTVILVIAGCYGSVFFVFHSPKNTRHIKLKHILLENFTSAKQIISNKTNIMLTPYYKQLNLLCRNIYSQETLSEAQTKEICEVADIKIEDYGIGA